MRKAIILAILAVAAIGAWLAYKEYHRTQPDLGAVRAAASLDAAALIGSFEGDAPAANDQYLGRVVEVSGAVKAVERDAGVVVLGEAGSSSSVRCAMDSVHAGVLAGLREGQRLTVKGVCTGFNPDELLGSDVILTRCVVVE